MHKMVWLQLYSGPRKMLFLYNHIGQPWDPSGWEAAAPQGEATTTQAGAPAAACQTSQDSTSPPQTEKAPGFLQGEKAPQHKFHQQNWSSLWLADKERSWFRGFPFHLWTMVHNPWGEDSHRCDIRAILQMISPKHRFLQAKRNGQFL